MELLNSSLNADEESLYSAFLHWYRAYQISDVEGLIECMDDEVLSIGTGNEEITSGKDALREGYIRDFREVRDISILNSEVTVKARGDHGWLFFKAVYNLDFPNGESTCYHTRRSIVYERKDGQWLQIHVHHSIPDPGQISDRSFSVGPEMSSRYLLLSTSSRDAILMVDIDSGDIVEANKAASELYGKSIVELVLQSVKGLMFPEEFSMFMSRLKECSDSGDIFECDQIGSHGVVQVEVSVRSANSFGRNIAICVIRDISKRKKTEEALRASEKRLRLALESNNDGLWEMVFPERLLSINDSFLRLIGFDVKSRVESYPMERWSSIVHPDDLKKIGWAFGRHFTDKKEFRIELRVKTAAGEWLWYLLRGRLVHFNPDGSPARMIGTIMDIDRRKKEEEMQSLRTKKLETMASIDKLTGIMNRQKFEDISEKLVVCSKKSGSSLSLIMFDLDLFKIVNDTGGHAEGDRLLIRVSSLVKSRLRSSDVFARWGGDEFMVLLSQDERDSLKVAEDIRDIIEKAFKNSATPVTASFGVATYRSCMDLEGFIMKADQAMYWAKEEGGNRVISSNNRRPDKNIVKEGVKL